jgi:hypothetical protein
MLRRGDYVLCNFPFREAAGPGPSPHIVLCAATGRQSGMRFAIVFYTTSQTDYQGAQRSRQYLFVSKERAVQLGQKAAFQVDSSRIARLPLTADYFPEMTGHTIPEASGNKPMPKWSQRCESAREHLRFSRNRRSSVPSPLAGEGQGGGLRANSDFE